MTNLAKAKDDENQSLQTDRQSQTTGGQLALAELNIPPVCRDVLAETSLSITLSNDSSNDEDAQDTASCESRTKNANEDAFNRCFGSDSDNVVVPG